MNWATRRKLFYLGIFFILFFGLVAGAYFAFFRQTANCFDGKQNGLETGLDCGGACTRLCPLENLDPIVEWSRAFELNATTHSLVAYVENPNINAGVSYAPYTFVVFDAQNKEIFKKEGATIIPPGKRFAVFEGPVSIEGTPSKVEFSFGSLVWDKMDRNDLAIKTSQIRMTRDVPTPRVDATISNESLNEAGNIEAVAIVYDETGNAIAASRTLVDTVAKEGSQGIVFTWPKPFKEQYARCEVPSNVGLVIDRSGSMASDSANPPEPLTSVKNAAKTFATGIGKGIDVSLVSFAGTASNPADLQLTASRERLTAAIDAINIGMTGIQETNIADALDAGQKTLMNSASTTVTRKVIILLTDGEPTLPKSAKEKDYPALMASQKALELKNNGIEIYSIGLGNKLNEQLLLDIATDPDHYFKAPTKTDVGAIYSRIATSLCVKHPIIEIITRVFPTNN